MRTFAIVVALVLGMLLPVADGATAEGDAGSGTGIIIGEVTTLDLHRRTIALGQQRILVPASVASLERLPPGPRVVVHVTTGEGRKVATQLSVAGP
jgi:hypothetical protein